MKSLFKYTLALLTACGISAAFSACQDDFDTPSVEEPVATLKPNTTIAELKEMFWQDAANYADTIGTRPDGSHYIISGTVVSSDEAGNVFKSITIQDETANIAFSINSYNLYLNYRRGQEVVIDVTGMFIGKYAGLQQFGLPSYYENGKTWQVGFMPLELFKNHAEVNGFPNTARIDTTVVDGFASLSTTPDRLRYWQSRLVRFNNVHFADGGKRKFSAYKSNANDSVNRNLIDAYGNTIVVRTSGYADFATTLLPEGSGDVVGLLGFYETLSGSTTWQLTLIDINGCMNFGNPTVAPGSESNPYTVPQAIDAIAAGKTNSAWTSGYIVGAVAPEVTSVKSNDDIEWSANPILDNTLVIAENPDVKDFKKVIVVNLPSGSSLRELGNLVAHPENYGKKMTVQGTPAMYMDTYGIADCSGARGTWSIEGVDTGGGQITDGNGSKESPFSANQVIQGSASGTAWVKGYIIGSSNGKTAAEMTVGASNPSVSNIFIASDPDETDYKKCVPVQLPTGTVRSALNLQNNPANVGKIVSVYGSCEAYFGQPGVKTVTDFDLQGGVTPPVTPDVEGSGTEADPYTVGAVIAINPQSTTETTYTGVWIKGYIVGWADMSTEYVINTNTARFSTPATLATNIILAASPDVSDVSKCIGIQLPSGAVRTALNLVDNPSNLGKQVLLKGDILKYSGIPGLRNTSDYKLDGAPDPGPDTPADPVTSIDQNFDASTSIPAGWSQVQIAGNKTWYVPTFNNNNYAAMTGYKGTAPFDSWLITPPVDIAKCADKNLSFDTQVNGYSSSTTVFEVYVLNDPDPAKATLKAKLSPELAVAPASGYSSWQASGNLSLAAYTGNIYIAFRYYATQDANYATWCLDNVKLNAGGTTDPADPTPPTPSGEYKGDFNSLNGGTPKASPYGQYTNATGWTAENSIILSGTDADTDGNPYFRFIGPAGTLAPTLNGKAAAPGSLVSPLLTGGIAKLSFKYGFAFTDTKCSFSVTVKDKDGNTIKSDTVTPETITKLQAYEYSLDVNYAGDFTIEIRNLCLSQATSNKDRVSIWNLTWTTL